MKILNLYAWLWGNRTKWGNGHEITAVEINPDIAKVYQDRFPNDTVIVWDAHEYLLENYDKYDFIWTSPPCQSHSSFRQNIGVRYRWVKAIYPDMKLWQEIIFLQANCKWKYVVENVVPFYEPLIAAKKRGRHLYWTNFNLPINLNERTDIKGIIGKNLGINFNKMCKFHDYDLNKYKGKQTKNKIAANLVDYEVGRTILETAIGIIRKENVNQLDIFS